MTTYLTKMHVFFSQSFLHVTYGEAALAIAILLVSLFLRKFVPWLLKLASNRLSVDDVFIDNESVQSATRPLEFIPIFIGIYIALHVLHLKGIPSEAAGRILKSIVSILTFWSVFRAISSFNILVYKSNTSLPKPVVEWLSRGLQILVIALAIGVVLEIWSIPVAPLIGSLGVFGIAIGLAAKDLFRNLIAGILILVEKRFVPGNWIKVEGIVEGTVERINFRSTLVRRFDLSPVFVPNADLSDNAVTNYSRMVYRRISWTIGIEYSATNEQLKQIRDAIEQWLLNDNRVCGPEETSLFVRIDRFGENAVEIMIYCFTRTTVWSEWLKIKEEFALAVKDIVKDSGTGFAFPSRSLFIEKIHSPLDHLSESGIAGNKAS